MVATRKRSVALWTNLLASCTPAEAFSRCVVTGDSALLGFERLAAPRPESLRWGLRLVGARLCSFLWMFEPPAGVDLPSPWRGLALWVDFELIAILICGVFIVV